jgi:enoyl-CoA hydratase
MSSISYEMKGHVAHVILNRPEAMNAFNYDMLKELEEVIEGIRIQKDIRVVTFKGAGEKSFSVWADLKER